MPWAPLRPCTTPGCRNLQPCPKHARRPWQQQRSRQERGYDAEWERIRKQVLAEEPQCRECLMARWLIRQTPYADSVREPVRPSTTVDHIIPKSLGGTNERSNLRGLCAMHQQRKASREGRAAQGEGG